MGSRALALGWPLAAGKGVAGPVVPVALGPTTASFTVGAASGSLIATITGLSSGETATAVSPNDGRIAISSGSALVVGLTASTAGTSRYTVTTSAGRTLTIDVTANAAVVVTTLLAGSRFSLNGYNANVGSNGTDTDSNSRISTHNDTGATVTKIRFIYTNWRLVLAVGSGEAAGYNAVTVEGSFEYPAGTFNRITFGGANSVSVPTTGEVVSDEITLTTPWVPDAQAWHRTYVVVPSGSKWCQSYSINTGFGETADFSTGVNKVLGGTITNGGGTTNKQGYGATAIVATATTGTRRNIAIAGIGDSITAGGALSRQDAKGNTGWVGLGCTGKAPYINMALAGTSAVDNNGAQFANRKSLLAKIGVTHVHIEYVNDLAYSTQFTETQIMTALTSIANDVVSSGCKVGIATVTPKTTSTNFFLSAAGQTLQSTPAGSYTGGTTSRRSKLNALIRAKPAPFSFVTEAADAVEIDGTGALVRDGGLWATVETGLAKIKPLFSTTVAAGATTTVIPTNAGTVGLNRWSLGYVRFDSGALAGTTALILTSTTGGQVTVQTALASAPAAGDAITLFELASRTTTDGLHPGVDSVYFGGQGILLDVMANAITSGAIS